MTYRIGASVLLLLTVAAAWVLGGWFGYRQVEQQSLEESFRYRQLVANELNRYLPIPELMAEHPLLAEALRFPDNPEVLLRANEEMQRMATIVGSSDVYLMDRTGLTIAANNYRQEDSFVGRNFSFRPYFYEALAAGDSAIYFALGLMSGVRGLYFSHPVRDDAGEVLGVVAVKVLVHELESQWHRPAALREAEMVVLDRDGVSFLASRPQWLYRDFSGPDSPPLSPEVRQRYPDRDLTPMNLRLLPRPWGVSEPSGKIRLEDAGAWREYLAVRTPLPRLDWTLQVMVSTRSVLWTRLGFVLAGGVIYVGAFLAWLYLRERYRREAELALRGEQLERRVAERTADLERSNRQLLAEIRERERAQSELRETQQELIQAAKLAVLGQMSAGLNHEMNQPITAIQAYARNSRRFLEKGALDMVDANLAEIVTLCGKMAELTRQFKVFARKSEGRPAVVDLRMPVDAALKIIMAQKDSEGIDIRWQRPERPVLCHGDLIRIEQVMVNLLANAVQAVEGRAQPEITIDIGEESGHWRCRVRDNGSGLPANTEQIFEPFFTTKSMKRGLGLGLSISRQIVDALGGRLTGHNRTDGPGAEFVLILQKRETAE
ncbi:ATP-binding protein [Marinobacter lutaoensis]|jgi:two-component system C4-dicarboxylate transport sensor histidine kinase DctB|uniref:C4-dicarboxylate transport sensor protein DctB n=1 Tax=Marinobacter lutaoensis TaxID=135739 RepID=A0A1V2DQH9_9GAMM|nr:ATP-binding protein [Marinobacter lutaoensis]MBE02707.1 sensor histidine kinase [Marinobacter sp.]MBI42581.1 sensor histidine kinase [Oceanospirillales bacterium]NVD34679.1 sensor histidine kinase [Marinobacter lutaoensis]ONF42789.1 histidine kinase [Marinobacter lutaoensis]